MGSTQPPEVLGLLGDPLRWQLVAELGRGDRTVGELVATLGKPQNLVSYHLGQLRNAGIVSARRSSADGRDVYYRADLVRCRDLLAAVGLTLHPGTSLAPAAPPTTRRGRPRVLFLCTGNSSRSQMAEALVEARSGGGVIARSAGSHPKPLHERAVAVMAARGIDIAGRESKSLTRFARNRFDRVVTLCDKVREICPELSGATDTAHWSIADPALDGSFAAVADEIEERVALLLADLGVRHLEGAGSA